MGEKRKKSLDTANLKEPRSKIWTKNSYGKWLCLCGTFYKYFLDGQPAFLELFIHDFCFTGNTATENHIMSVAIALQSSLTLITPAVVPKRHTLFAMIFWNNCVCLNICPAVLNVEHFERRWVWLSFNNTFYKDGRPQAPTSVHQCLYHICTHRGRGPWKVLQRLGHHFAEELIEVDCDKQAL